MAIVTRGRASRVAIRKSATAARTTTRLQLEHDEAASLLQQQRSLITDLEKIRASDSHSLLTARLSAPDWQTAARQANELLASSRADNHEPLQVRYRELLRTYVIMGSGNLADEIRRLSEQFALANFTSQQVLRLHLHALEEAVQGLGSRSARHVMNRADLLVLEVTLNLAEAYRQRSLESTDNSRAVA